MRRWHWPLADPRGRQGRAPLGPNSFVFMEWLREIEESNRLASPPLWLAPPPLGNLGSATVNVQCKWTLAQRLTTGVILLLFPLFYENFWSPDGNENILYGNGVTIYICMISQEIPHANAKSHFCVAVHTKMMYYTPQGSAEIGYLFEYCHYVSNVAAVLPE